MKEYIFRGLFICGVFAAGHNWEMMGWFSVFLGVASGLPLFFDTALIHCDRSVT